MSATHVGVYDSLFKDYLQVRDSEVFGRGVYSKKRLVEGVEIIRSEPVAHVISKKERGRRCDWCCVRKDGGQLRKCSRCKLVRYCGSTCQRNDWSYHKIECNGILAISPNVPTDTVRLLVRLFTKKIRPHPQHNAVLPPGVNWEMDCMTSHAPRYSEELKESIASQVMGAKLLIGEQESINMEELYIMACKLACNTFNILDDEMISIGMGVYLAPTFLNHSCDPNCIAMFDGYTVKIRTLKTIEPDEQLFISYCELLDTRERRKKYLQKYHLFVCTCDRCHGDKDETSPDRLLTSTTSGLSQSQGKQLLDDGFTLIERCNQLRETSQWAELKDASTAFLTNHIDQLGELNIVTVKLNEQLMDAYIELCQWKDALSVARSLKIAYEKLFASVSPFLGLHYYKMAKLINQVSGNDVSLLKESVSLLDKCVGVLSVTHGSDHTLVTDSKGLIMDLNSEILMQKQ